MKISIALAALTGSFETDMNRASKTAQKRMKEIEKTAKEVGRAVGIALTAAATAIAAGTKLAIDRMDEITKSAQKVGITTESFSKLAYAAGLAGVETGALETSLAKLARSQDDAARGTKETLDLFRALGVEFQNADGMLRNTDEVLADLADRFQAMPDGAQKTAAAMGLLGRSGAQLIPLLNGGSAGLAEMGDELERLGGVVTPEAGRQAEQFNDNLTRLKVATDALFQAVAADLLPDLVRLTEAFVDGAKEGEGYAGVAEDISAAISTVAETAYRAYKNLELLINGVTELAARGTQAAAANPFSGLGLADRLFFGGAISREAGILAESSAFRAAEAAAAADEGLGLGRGTYTDPVKEAQEEAKRSAAREAEAKARAAALEIERGAQERAAAARLAAAEAARAQAEAERELKRIQDAGVAAAEALTQTIQQRAADLAGPAAQAARAYADEMLRLTVEEQKLRDAKLLTGQVERELAIAREQAFEQYQRQLDEIEEQRSGPVKQLLADLQFEAELLGMTNVEREKAIALRWANVDAASAEGQAIAKAIEEIEAAQEQIEGQDFFRREVQGVFSDVLSGAKSAKDAINDLFDTLVARALDVLARNLTEQLFGAFGTTNGGAAGGGFGAFLGALFGGARAGGGDVLPGRAYLVGEEGPELVMPQSAGTVIPARQTAAMLGGSRGGDTYIIQGATSNRSLERIRMERDRADRKAQREFA